MIDRAAIRQEFTAILRDYLVRQDESTLTRAYELGRRALTGGMGVLEMADLQIAAVHALAELGWPPAFLMQMEACQRCFLEALSVFEMTHRGFQEANAALRHFNEALENEIKRIGHILHGQTGQLLAAINLELSTLVRKPADGTVRTVQRIQELLAQVEEQVRHLTHEIRPTVLDDLGLVPAIEFLRDGVEQRSPLRVHVDGPVADRFPQAIEVAVYRVIQEAMNNVIKHAKAANVFVVVRAAPRRLVCTVRDDGMGFDPGAAASGTGERGFGLIGMHERLHQVGGTLEIRSTPGQGTEVVMSIPLVLT